MGKSIYHKYHDNEYRFTLYESGKYDFDITRVKEAKRVPDFLYKYYPLNKFSLSALSDSYLYASHPLQLNDKYDCSDAFVDVSGLSLEDYLSSFLKNMLSEEKIEDMFKNHREILDKEFLKWEHVRLFQQFGIISMCENHNDLLMWAYYAQNNGFLVKFETDKLPSDFYGPYPINYVDEIAKIDIAKKSPILSLLYQSNVKSKKWNNEDEWRYIVRNPKGQYHPFYVKKDYKSRFQHYDVSSIREIHLGYDFVLPTEVDWSKTTEISETIRFKTNTDDHKFKRKLLTFIVKNKIPCFRMVKKLNEFKLGRQSIKISRISSHRYIFELGEYVD